MRGRASWEGWNKEGEGKKEGMRRREGGGNGKIKRANSEGKGGKEYVGGKGAETVK